MPLTLVRPRFFFALDQTVERRMQWRRNSRAGGFTSDRSTQKINFRSKFVPDVIQHGRGMICLRANFVHLPWVFIKFYAQARCHTLSLFHESMQEVTEIAKIFFFRKMKTVRQ